LDVENSRISKLIEQIRDLEGQLRQEYGKNRERFYYDLKNKRFKLSRERIKAYKKNVINSFKYVYKAKLSVLLTVPVIWAVLLPAIVLDLFVSLYQAVCFPVYKIPKVKRSHYIVLDRHKLFYLNNIQKLNCLYCGYFNGLVGFVREVAARTEQHWCPIKHATPIPDIHSRYEKFFDYGDAMMFQNKLAPVRYDFSDIDETFTFTAA
jgi:hypothetical protein